MHGTRKFLVAIAACTVFGAVASTKSATAVRGAPLAIAIADDNVSPIYGVTIPAGYRQWEFIAPSQETGRLDELRGILGNAAAIKAYRDGTLPFPNGAILVKLAWKHVPLAGVDGAFVSGPATTVQIMVKDSKKYPSSGGWGFGRFIDGKPVDAAQHKTCFPCHSSHVKDRDYVFTRYAP